MSILLQLQLQLQKKLVTAKEQLKCFVAVQNVCLGLFIDKTCVRDFLFENPLNTDTVIIWTFWHVPLVSVLTGFHYTAIRLSGNWQYFSYTTKLQGKILKCPS